MTATVTQLLAHPALAGLRRLAGQNNPTIRAVRGFWHAGAGPVTWEAVGTGDALVLLSTDKSGGWQFDALLRKAAEAGVEVLVLGDDTVVDAGSVLLAERLGIVILACEDPWAVGVAVRDLVGSGLALRAAAVIAAARTGRRAGDSVEDLLTSISGDLLRPVYLYDSSGHQLAQSANATESVPAGSLAQLFGSNLPTGLKLPSGAVAVACPVASGLRPLSWLVALLESPTQAEESAVFAALDVDCVAVGHRLALMRMASERNARQRTALLVEVTDLTAEVSQELRRRALSADWALEGWHLAARVIARTEVDVVAGRLEVLRALTAERLDGQVVEQSNGWAVWITWPNEPEPAVVEQAVASLRRAQRSWETTTATQVGVGRIRPGPTGIGASLAEASDAAVLVGGRPQTGRFMHVDRLGLAQLLLAWTRTDTFQPAANELLAPLREVGGDLLATLTAFLDAESSFVAAAAVLGVHRNTVADRIARAGHLLSVDLTDPETRLALHLACRTVER